MKFIQLLLIRLGLKRVTQQDVAQGVREKDIKLLRLVLRAGNYRARGSAALALGQIRAKKAIPELTRLLWDDFETVAEAARKSLQAFLPDPQITRQLNRFRLYRENKEELRSLKRKAIWYNTNNPLQPPAPLIDRSKMQMLAKVKVQLQKPIRLWS